MEITQFVQDFASVFEDTDASEITSTTVFKDLEEWDSLTTLAVIGMVNKTYGIKVTGSDVREADTIQDLFNLVESRK